MFRTVLSALAAIVLIGASAPPAAAAPDHAPFDVLLARYVKPGADGLNRVDYAGFKAATADRAALSAYIADLADEKVSALPRDAQFALWANLYNALTLQVVLEAYPVASIRSIRSKGAGLNPAALIGPWKTKLVTVEGRSLSLDDIEHKILRPTFKDPRVHYAVNCASVGCPNLQVSAFKPETLNAQLEAAAIAYINDPRGITVGDKGLTLSRIYDWFAVDFGDAAGLRAHLARYAKGDRAAALKAQAKFTGYAYDWSLNDAKGAR